MLKKPLTKILVAGIIAAASVSPTFAKMEKIPDACATPRLRCTVASTCDQAGWCKVYGCLAGKTVLLPFYCNDKLGGCAQKHC